jgi:hypothetical protein
VYSLESRYATFELEQKDSQPKAPELKVELAVPYYMKLN